jgi:tetratricopeptide (TPR) repeat protein
VRKLPLIAALAGLAAAAPAAHAQRLRVHDVPARPALWAQADTNSANVYYLWGLQNVERDPERAAAAFYWAERLNPGWADALYGRRTALLMTNPQRLVDYLEGRAYTQRDAEIVAMDSLVLRATQRSPFLYTVLEKPFWMTYFRTLFGDMVRRVTGSVNVADADYLLQRELANNTDPSLQAWLDYSSGRFPAAAQGYQRALRRSPRSFGLRVQMGHARFMAGDFPGAAAAMAEAIAQGRERDRREVVRVYDSKAILEFSRATALEQAGDSVAANEAYSRALEEDLAFWPAHRRLSERALERGDTATAVAEMALAVELAPTEADLRYDHALLLLESHKVLDAVAELSKAVELDPYYASPHYVLAVLNDHAQVTTDAAEHYRHFLALAARDDERRETAQERLAANAAPATP